jgi:hypothetical protein
LYSFISSYDRNTGTSFSSAIIVGNYLTGNRSVAFSTNQNRAVGHCFCLKIRVRFLEKEPQKPTATMADEKSRKPAGDLKRHFRVDKQLKKWS